MGEEGDGTGDRDTKNLQAPIDTETLQMMAKAPGLCIHCKALNSADKAYLRLSKSLT